MVTDILQPTHLLFILVVALLVLGPKRLPEVARTLGNGLRDFRSAISGEDDERPGRPGHYALPEEDDSPSSHEDNEPVAPSHPAPTPPAPTQSSALVTAEPADAPPADPPPAPPPAEPTAPAADPAATAVHEPAPSSPPTEERLAPTEQAPAPHHDSSGSPPA